MAAARKPSLPRIASDVSSESMRAVYHGVKSIRGAADFTAKSRTVIKQLIRDGVLSSWIAGGKRVIPLRELRELLAYERDAALRVARA